MKTKDDLILEQLYTEGIWDRIKQRVHGVGSFLQGKGYNAGKTEKLNQTLKDRIKTDIDKFLREIQTMGGLTSLAEFENQYPHLAQKVACMADAIGHTTALTTKCSIGAPPTTTPPTTTPPTTTPQTVANNVARKVNQTWKNQTRINGRFGPKIQQKSP